MFDTQYTYAVARVRSLEAALLTMSDMERLIACPDVPACLAFLSEKGWGDADSTDAEAILRREEEKTWENMRGMNADLSVLDVLSLPDRYHNLKAAIKELCRTRSHPGIFVENTTPSGEEMMKLIQNGEFDRLPDGMEKPAKEAYETMLHSHDGQLCDIIIDRACLEAVLEAGRRSKEELVKQYAEQTVAIADIKIAVRASNMNKSREFMQRAMVPCASLRVESLIKAAQNGVEAICEYLKQGSFSEGADALAQSLSAFERWCDNRMIDTIRPQKYESFSAGPLLAYVLARESEIQTVRMILTGKANRLSEEAIRERVRVTYA